ncbi:GHKL domain-containing protein [Silvanigrella paludirubra]|uniref:GHKL domain-containing protein n=1 Tax=Silvanigrella paludirubra TaxID=2499159 RepID=A0A6N6VV77_9BACT|nr:ATP-binding protein [Silvanigrella paludirubra]KAB8036991.1 GHKL domain-containing protein [Silvanigrella paludirubra]
MINKKLKKFNKKFHLFYWLLTSVIISFLFLIIDIIIINHQLKDYYLSTFGYTEYLMQNNYSLEAYRRLIEVSSSIYVYERVEKNNFFAAEIWDCVQCKDNKFPIWQTNASSISEIKNVILLEGILKKVNSIFIYNNSLIIGVSFPIYSYKIANEKVFQQKKYTLKFYKKALDYKIFKDGTTFIEVFTILNILVFLSLIFFIMIPISILKTKVAKNTAKKIESKTLENIKNMIEHELVNQENILKYPYDLKSSIHAALHHNNVAQIILRKIRIESINPLDVLEEVWKNIGNTHIKLSCYINIGHKIKFDRSTLFLAFNTIIKNAVHENVLASKIEVKITQNWFYKLKKIILIEISNDGVKIPKEIRGKILNGFTNKPDGHGIGLKNLKEILQKNGSKLFLHNQNITCFSFFVRASEEKYELNQNYILENSIKNLKEKEKIKFCTKSDKPLVVIIEDNELIWHGWEVKMIDANILFFRTPDEFFCHIDEEKMNGNNYLTNIAAIVSDFDFGNGVNFINSNLIGGIENEEEKFNGKIILCSGFNEKIQKDIPIYMKEKIDLFFQKRPITYNEIMDMIENFNKSKVIN